MMKYIFSFMGAVLLTFLVGCSHSSAPEGVLSVEKLTPIIEEIHLTDAILQNEHTSKKSEKALQYYAYIYEKHSITKEQFEVSMAYYAKHPDELREAYTTVLANLGTRDSILKVAQANQIDTVQLWNGKSNYSVDKYTTETLPVCLPVKYQKTYTISAEIRIFEDSQVKEIKPYFAFESPDTTYVLDVEEIKVDTIFHRIEVSALVEDSTVTDLGGDFFPASEQGVELLKHYEIRNIKITTTQLRSELEKEKTIEL